MTEGKKPHPPASVPSVLIPETRQCEDALGCPQHHARGWACAKTASFLVSGRKWEGLFALGMDVPELSAAVMQKLCLMFPLTWWA